MGRNFCVGYLARLCASCSVTIKRDITRNFTYSSYRAEKKEDDLATTEKTVNLVNNSDNKLATKNTDDDIIIGKEYSKTSSWNESDLLVEDPLTRVKRVLKYDFLHGKERIMTRLGFDFEPRAHKYYYGPTVCDLLIIGGGAIGSSCAYWIKSKVDEGYRVVVIERDMTYSKSSTNLVVEGLRQQFSLPENVEMSLFGHDFIRRASYLLQVDDLPTPDLSYEPYGYLLLASEEGAETLLKNSEWQKSMGCSNILLNPKRLRERFPWLNTNGIVLGCLGLAKEGWFDPWGLKLSLKCKAISLGAEYVEGEVVGFEFGIPEGSEYDQNFRYVKSVIMRRPDGLCIKVGFSRCVVAAGADSGAIGQLLGLGHGRGILSVALPIQRRKRYMYYFHSPNGPGINTPLVIDPRGFSIRRDGLTGDFITSVCPSPEEDVVANQVEAEQYFYDKIRPSMARRIPSFQDAKLTKVWAGFCEYNTLDMNGIIGRHPLLLNIYFACGFNTLGIQHAPAVGRAISELILSGSYLSIDLKRLAFDRVGRRKPLLEEKIL